MKQQHLRETDLEQGLLVLSSGSDSEGETYDDSLQNQQQQQRHGVRPVRHDLNELEPINRGSVILHTLFYTGLVAAAVWSSFGLLNPEKQWQGHRLPHEVQQRLSFATFAFSSTLIITRMVPNLFSSAEMASRPTYSSFAYGILATAAAAAWIYANRHSTSEIALGFAVALIGRMFVTIPRGCCRKDKGGWQPEQSPVALSAYRGKIAINTVFSVIAVAALTVAIASFVGENPVVPTIPRKTAVGLATSVLGLVAANIMKNPQPEELVSMPFVYTIMALFAGGMTCALSVNQNWPQGVFMFGAGIFGTGVGTAAKMVRDLTVKANTYRITPGS